MIFLWHTLTYNPRFANAETERLLPSADVEELLGRLDQILEPGSMDVARLVWCGKLGTVDGSSLRTGT
jgi:hypothetical protein